MVTTCPPAFSAAATADEDAEKRALVRSCEAWTTETFLYLSDINVYHNLPLTTKTGITYANYYCAVCNSVVDDFSFWRLIVLNIGHYDLPKTQDFYLNVGMSTVRLPVFEISPVLGLNLIHRLCYMPIADLWPIKTKKEIMECFVDLLTNETGVDWKNACNYKYNDLPQFDLTILVIDNNLMIETNEVEAPQVKVKENDVRSCDPLNGTSSERVTKQKDTTRDENTVENRGFMHLCFVPSISGGCVKVPCLSHTFKSNENASVNISGQAARFAHHGFILKHLSLASLLISLLSILLVLIIYVVSPSLRSHFVTLQLHCFSADVFSILTFIIASFASFKQIPGWLCRGIAIAAHFSFLSVFSWRNILAWSIFLMVHRAKTRVSNIADGTNFDTSFRGIASYMTAWATPLLLVAVGVGMNIAAENFMDYGSDGLCWMSWKHPGIIYLFLLPSGVALLINIILVIATALSLIHIRSAQAPMLHSSCLTVECIFGVLARMSISLCLEWILAFLMYFLPNYLYLRYAFVLVVGLHGLWLLISTLTLPLCHKLYERMRASLLRIVHQGC